MTERLLEVRELDTQFATRAGPVHAVDGVDLHIDQGETLGIIAQAAIVSALVANSVVKSAIAFVRGSRTLAWRATIALMSSALAATIALGAEYLIAGG